MTHASNRLSYRTLALVILLTASNLPAPDGVLDPGAKKKRFWPDNPHAIGGMEQEVFAEILTLPNNRAKLLALNALAERWSKSNRDAAWAKAETITDGTLRPAFLRGLMPEMVKHDPEKVLAKLEEGFWWPDQWLHVKDATVKVAKTDLDRAVRVFEEATPKRIQNEWVTLNLARELVSQCSPEKAKEFAARQEPGKHRNTAFRGVGEALIREDETRAIEWVETLEEGSTERRYALFGLVVGKGWKEDPEASIAWAAGLVIDELRRRALLEMAWQWSQSNELDRVKSMMENPVVLLEDRAFVQERLQASGVFLD